MAGKIVIRRIREAVEFDALVEIQRTVWKHEDVDLTPVHQFYITSRMGGILLGAFADGKIAGFVYAFPAVHDGGLSYHSHLLAVLPEFQGLGIGRKLKEAQRRECLARGCGLITWTFDPLLARNANLNFHALCARSRTYFKDFYGRTPSLSPAPGIPTDRLLVEWPVRKTDEKRDRNREEKRTGKKAMPELFKKFSPMALEARSGAEAYPEPAPAKLNLKSDEILVEIPRTIELLKQRPEKIRAWQEGLRSVLPSYFRRGYGIEDFLFGDRCFYVLRKSS